MLSCHFKSPLRSQQSQLSNDVYLPGQIPCKYPGHTGSLGSIFFDRCVNTLFYRQVSLGERKVHLMRHIPLLGCLGILKWQWVNGFLPSTLQHDKINSSDLLVLTTGKTVSLASVSTDGRQIESHFIPCSYSWKTELVIDFTTGFVSTASVVMPLFFSNMRYTVIPITLGVHWYLQKILCLPGCLDTKEYVPQMGVLISGGNTCNFQHQLNALSHECQERQVKYQLLSNNCSTQAGRLLGNAIAPELKAHLGEPLLFWTPTDVFIRACNINALNKVFHKIR